MVAACPFPGNHGSPASIREMSMALADLGHNIHIVTYPMGTAFKTFLYAYALDRRDGFSKPSRLPSELKGEFNTLVKQFESKDKKRKMPKPSF